MNKREHERRAHQERTLQSLGFTPDECDQLRRISNTLRRWYELECGTSNGHIERDEETGKPYFRESYSGGRWAVTDREKGAIRRLQKIISNRNQRVLANTPESADWANQAFDAMVTPYLQTDPRGAALYILRPGDVPEGADVSDWYSRGICVY